MQKTILLAWRGWLELCLDTGFRRYVARQSGETFPWGTIAVNLIGCLVTGAVFYVSEERLMINLYGAICNSDRPARRIHNVLSLTQLQMFVLLRDGSYGLATLNIVTSEYFSDCSWCGLDTR